MAVASGNAARRTRGRPGTIAGAQRELRAHKMACALCALRKGPLAGWCQDGWDLARELKRITSKRKMARAAAAGLEALF